MLKVERQTMPIWRMWLPLVYSNRTGRWFHIHCNDGFTGSAYCTCWYIASFRRRYCIALDGWRVPENCLSPYNLKDSG
jgi:hypothetical protein